MVDKKNENDAAPRGVLAVVMISCSKESKELK
jgi:hypothetical protein